nr:4-oxalocrotonate tautomerase family protein [Cedecea neteri]
MHSSSAARSWPWTAAAPPGSGNRGNAMPYVNIRVTREGVSAEQKLALIEGVTDLLEQVLNKKPADTFVVIDEVETDNWGVNRESVSARRRREAGL